MSTLIKQEGAQAFTGKWCSVEDGHAVSFRVQGRFTDKQQAYVLQVLAVPKLFKTPRAETCWYSEKNKEKKNVQKWHNILRSKSITILDEMLQRCEGKSCNEHHVQQALHDAAGEMVKYLQNLEHDSKLRNSFVSILKVLISNTSTQTTE